MGVFKNVVKTTKAALKTAVKAALAKAKEAVVKLVKTKLLRKAEEKYCKVLQGTTEKLVEKCGDFIDDINSATNEKKKFAKLYALELCVATMDTVAEALSIAVANIKKDVDFSILHKEENSDVLTEAIAEATTPAEGDAEATCGEDGCEIG